MPLPNAKPDKRIYELLKNVDLENLTFADLQSVGQTIFAEQGAEDELRRLVLVNLARMSVAGEWTGLTSAGGGGGYYLGDVSTVSTNYQYLDITRQYLTGGSLMKNQAVGIQGRYHPFVSSTTGNIANLSLYVSSAAAGRSIIVGIYDAPDGFPKTLLGTATIDASTTGFKTQTTFSNPITLTAGTMYFAGICRDGSTSVNAYAPSTSPAMWVTRNTWSTTDYPTLTVTGAPSYSLPTTIDPADIQNSPDDPIVCSIGW